MKNRKSQHRSTDLAELAKRAVANAKQRRAVALDEAELRSATGGGGWIGGQTSGAILNADSHDGLL